jgi:hypothetical protein
MTSWATITMEVDDDAKKFTGPPTGLEIDKGNEELGWHDGRLYALSYGRYQHKRYIAHVEDFDSPWFNGVWHAIICEVENTGDNVTAYYYRAKQNGFSGVRMDGMKHTETFTGKRWPADGRNEFIDYVEEETGLRPVVEPIETTTPPDAVIKQ